MYRRGGRYAGRHVGSTRGDLIGQILQQQASAGIAPPPPPISATSSSRTSRGRKARAAR